MSIVGVNASPRKHGNTAWAVNQALEGAAAQGAQTRFFHIGAMNISPCKACNACAKGGGCAINDDMGEIYAALKTADALVLGSPIYMGQMAGQMKVFIDRLYARFKPRFSPAFQAEYAGKKLALVWTQGNPDAGKFKEYLDYTEKMFGLLEFQGRGAVLVAGTREAATEEQEGLAEELWALGSNLAR